MPRKKKPPRGPGRPPGYDDAKRHTQTVLNIRVLYDERERFQRSADAAGTTVSDDVRRELDRLAAERLGS